MKYILLWVTLFLIPVFSVHSHKKITAIKNTGIVKVRFVNTIKGKPVELNTRKYSNPFGEEYSVSKFKYYIGHLSFTGDAVIMEESYHLVDESKPESLYFDFTIKPGTYTSIAFMLGVDSLHNVRGAQTGALDPLNDMFWTWNSGYVMAKLEGNSPQSALVNNKLEYHIGGFSGLHSVLKNISLNFPQENALAVKPGKTSEIIIEADIDGWWGPANDIKIAEHPVCSTPGALAKKIANNYSNMFRIKKVVNY
jgi:hypothetical protein